MTDVLCFFKRRRQRMEQAKANNKWPTVSLPIDNRKCFMINQPIVDAIGELSLLSHFYNNKNKAADNETRLKIGKSACLKKQQQQQQASRTRNESNRRRLHLAMQNSLNCRIKLRKDDNNMKQWKKHARAHNGRTDWLAHTCCTNQRTRFRKVDAKKLSNNKSEQSDQWSAELKQNAPCRQAIKVKLPTTWPSRRTLAPTIVNHAPYDRVKASDKCYKSKIPAHCSISALSSKRAN
ncbi:hypothetical protein T11_1777 [Trichinella zimbabwensis]|uniref:Uncharacterized protein n=1 Tax=Trichinella zimbabwensis TaxID=268475 RepID=A0A0V1I0U1_9BILA|nr:hypothetical protein T11_1777 [Trichinella zimbabwensis]